MKAFSVRKKILSVLLAIVTVIGVISPGFAAVAAEGDGGVIPVYELEILYEDGTLVPTYQEDGKTKYIEYMHEADKKQFQYKLKDCEIPTNGYVKWNSDTPTVCDVTPEGIVRAFDSSKGAAVRLWLDNEVATIPLVGGIMKKALEKALFNDKINVDTMDTDEIIAAVEAAFGSDSVLAKYIESYKGELVDSLRKYLDKVNTVISCTLYDGDGKELATDSFEVCVKKSQEYWADFLPNGTHITNKQNLPTTVAKGTTQQISACTTPTRLHMGVIYSVKNSSVLSSGKAVATVTDSGLVTFKNTGTVTILVSPDTDGFIQNLLKYINYLYKLQNTGTIDTGKIADILIKLGLDINRNVLMAILDACFAIKDIVGDSADAVQLTATAIKIIANLILQFTTNDSVTFTVIEGVPCTNFDIKGVNTVKEGEKIYLTIENAKPEAANTSDITWESSNPAVASVDPITGTVTGRDAGGSLGQYSQQTVDIIATSAANDVKKTITITVTGKTGDNQISDVVINKEKSTVNIGETQQLSATVYPERAQNSKYLSLQWGIATVNSETGKTEYQWATKPYQEKDEEGNLLTDESGNPVMNDGSVTDGIGKVDCNGVYTAVSGGTSRIACMAKTGYSLAGSNYYEISSATGETAVDNGQPVSEIKIAATGTTSGGTLTTKDVEINGITYHYATVKKTVGSGLAGNGCVVQATISPDNATNKTVHWFIDNEEDYSLKDNKDGTAEIKMKAAVEKATAVNVYCVSDDGTVKSDVLTIAVTRNYAESNTIDTKDISITNGTTMEVTHTLKPSYTAGFTGSAYTCYHTNWYSSDPDIVSIESVDENGNAIISANDVGVVTIYCVSADGAIVDSTTVTSYPDKARLNEILDLCEHTVIKKNKDNAATYKEYMRKLNYCYYLSNEAPLAAQNMVDTYSNELLYIFYRLGGYIGLGGVKILNSSAEEVGENISVKVGAVANYKKAKCQLKYELKPKSAMYSKIKWSSSDPSAVSVDNNGLCRPVSNSACHAVITVTVTDYFGETVSESVNVAFAKTQATGIELSAESIVGAKVGEPQQLKAIVLPKNLIGSTADIKDVVWYSSNDKVASVDQNGNLTFNYGGDCVITAVTADGGFAAECKVNVVTNYDKLQELVNTYISFNLQRENYYPDTYEAYTSKIKEASDLIAANASTQDEVEQMYAELEAAYKGLKKYTFVQKIELYKDGEPTADYYQYNLKLLKGEYDYSKAQLDLKVRLYPNNADYKSVVWTSENSDDISVSQDGVARPVDKTNILKDKGVYGRIVCTVTDHFGKTYSDDVWVSFAYYPVTGVSLTEKSITGSVGSTAQLVPVIEPEGTLITATGSASIKAVQWVSDDENVATVDENGLVTFTGAGATKIRVITCDGGFTDECAVSTDGDRAALSEAVEKYKNVNYMDYKYSVGMAFKAALEEAQAALVDNTLNQEQINNAAEKLNAAGEALAGNEFVKAETINVAYNNQTRGAISYESKSNGTLAADAATHSYQGKKLLYNRTVLTASIPEAAKDNYTSLKWTVVDKTSGANVEIGENTITIASSTTGGTAKATVLCTATDTYGRTVERQLRVVVATEIVTGISLDKQTVQQYANAGEFKLTANVEPSDAKVKDVIWYSSDNSVATVDENGTVTPRNNGTAVITAETFDGSYKASCTVTLSVDYSELAALYQKYNDFYLENKDTHTYTNASLAALKTNIDLAKSIVTDSIASQEDVEKMIVKLNDSFNNLVLFVPVKSVSLSLAEGSNGTELNPGFIRYNATSINGISVNLVAAFDPAESCGATVSWKSSNSSISVDENGVVTNNTAFGGYALITATATDEAGNTAESSVYVSFVRNVVSSVSFSEEIVHGAPGTTVTLNPTVSGTSALAVPTVKTCVYKSSDENIATVDENGVVTFVKAGECTITAYSADGGISASVRAFTTNDNTALNAAVKQYASVNYMDYAYDYGMAFKTAYENAVKVNSDYFSTQDAIDSALTALQTAYNELAEHPFIAPGNLVLAVNGAEIENGATYVKDEANTVVVNASCADGAMIKSSQITFANEKSVNVSVSGNTAIITKANDDAFGSVDITYTVVDDYGRESTVTKNIKITDKVQLIESFKFVYGGAEVESVSYKAFVVINQTVQLSINTYPEAAEAYTSVKWSSSSNSITVDENGLVKCTSARGGSATITCTVTLSDGSEITNTIPVSFAIGR